MRRWILVTLAFLTMACGQEDGFTPATLTVSVEALDFGEVPQGTAQTLTFTLTNGGDGELTINSVSIVEGEAGAWDLERTGADTLEGGASQEVSVEFSPSQDKDYLGRIQIRSSDQSTGSVYVSMSGSGGPSTADDDEDGYSVADGDCDDDDAQRYPGNTEICDGKDNDCDLVVPTAESDADYDGYRLCSTEADCDDTDPNVYPGAAEICDNKDSDCDGVNRDDEDGDGDGYSICENDCDDEDADRYPGNAETCDGKDNDCVGGIDDLDADGDGHSLCDASSDCDDTNADLHPLVVDDDGDGEAPDGTPDKPFTTLGAAINAYTGDADCPIYVMGGVYPTSITLSGVGEIHVVGASQGRVMLTSPEGGGGIFTVTSGTHLYISNLTFSGGQRASDGGALSVTSGGEATASQVGFEYCTSEGDGGALSVSGGTVTLSEATFSGNTAAGDGGAIAVADGDAFLSGCTIEGNLATDDGGGLAALNSDIIDEGSTWMNNYGGRGGAIFATGSGISLDGVHLESNSANNSGGAAWIGSPRELTLTASRLWSNFSVGDGGALHLSEAISEGSLISGNLFQDNFAGGRGGGLMIEGEDAAVQISNNTLTSGIAGGVSEDGDGAGIFIDVDGDGAALIANIVAWSRGNDGIHRTTAGAITTYNTVFNTTSQVEFGGALAHLDYDPGATPPEAEPGEEENRVENPVFNDFTQGGPPQDDNLTLRSDSPAIDTGPEDEAFEDRDGSRNDRGAYGGPYAID